MTKQEKQPIKEKTPLKIKVEPKETRQLQELKLSWAGKLFFAGAAAYIGAQAYKGYKAAKAPKLPIKIRGSKQQIKSVMDAIAGSADFQREINRPGATIEKVIDKLKLKNLNKQSFEKLTKRRWPL